MICRMCKGCDLNCFLDLGFTPPADQFRRRDQLRDPIISYPLDVYLCGGCGLAQLGTVVNKEVLYLDDYPYESSTTKAGRSHFYGFAAGVVARFGLGSRELTVDVGSNVGVLLSGFKAHGLRVVGVEPAAHIARIARENGVETVVDFFGVSAALKIVSQHGRAALLTGSNVFAHIDDMDGFMQAAELLLADEGVLIIEAPHFMNLVRDLEYDTIYHEHLSYLSLRPMQAFFERRGWEVFAVTREDIHGGSFRTFAARQGRYPVEAAVRAMLSEEADFRLHEIDTLRDFAEQVRQNRYALRSLIRELRSQGSRVVGVSAPAKGMTLLNYCNLGREELEYVTEKSALKIGKYTPGGQIPVVPDRQLIQEFPDYALLLAWNFAEEIMHNLAEYRAKGGRFIVPIPRPRIVE